MTDRYTLTQPEAVAGRFQLPAALKGKPNYNMHRGVKNPTISRSRAGENEIVHRLFGFIPPWETETETTAHCFARAETVLERKTFSRAFQTSRCLVIADGYFMWDAAKQPYYVRLKSKALFGMAGFSSLNAHYRPPLATFGLLTIYPNELVAEVHSRMPVILRPEHEEAYLDSATPIEEVCRLLMPYNADEMEMYKVTPALNRARSNSRKFIEPIESTQEQLSLLEMF